jgi:hypothetical protein
MLAAVVLSDQRKEEPPLAVRITEPPSQNVVGPLGVITATGAGFTVTVNEIVAEHPSAENPVTV